MKKITLLTAVSVATLFSACKKDYTCECTTGNSTEKYVIKNVTKGQAKANCVSYSETSNGVTTQTNCSLK